MSQKETDLSCSSTSRHCIAGEYNTEYKVREISSSYNDTSLVKTAEKLQNII